jgi:hypothetical protein
MLSSSLVSSNPRRMDTVEHPKNLNIQVDCSYIYNCVSQVMFFLWVSGWCVLVSSVAGVLLVQSVLSFFTVIIVYLVKTEIDHGISVITIIQNFL